MTQITNHTLLCRQEAPDPLNPVVANTKGTRAKARVEHVITLTEDKPNLVICLPAGSTPGLFYSCLRISRILGKAGFSEARIVAVDECLGASPNLSRSEKYDALGALIHCSAPTFWSVAAFRDLARVTITATIELLVPKTSSHKPRMKQ